jgi:hypothetical protein
MSAVLAGRADSWFLKITMTDRSAPRLRAFAWLAVNPVPEALSWLGAALAFPVAVAVGMAPAIRPRVAKESPIVRYRRRMTMSFR